MFAASKKHISLSTTDATSQCKGGKKILQTNGPKKEMGFTVLMSVKTRSETKITSDKGIVYVISPQCNKTRHKQQEKLWKNTQTGGG